MTSSTFTRIRRSFVTAGVALCVLVPLAPAAAQAASVPTVPAAAVSTGPAPTVVRSAAAAAVPAGFKLRTTRYWSWFGPSGWTGSYGAYGITVTAPGGVATRDFGFSSTLCSPGTTWAQSTARNFNARQAAVVRQSGAKAWKWLTVGTVTAVGPLQSRKVLTFDATLRNGSVIRGTIIFMYAYNTGQYCYQSSDARTAVRTRYAAMIGVLNNIAKYTTYRGPGACDPSPQLVC